MKALFRIKAYGTAAKTDGNLIHHSAATDQFCCSSVKIGIVDAVPQMYIFDGEADTGMTIHCVLAPALLIYGNHYSIAALMPGFHHYIGASAIGVHDRGHPDPRSAIFFQFKVCAGRGYQIHVAVQAAVEGEIRLLGIDKIILPVVYTDADQAAILKRIRNIHAEGRVTAFMAAKLLTIYINLCNAGRAPHFKKCFSLRLQFRFF